MRYDELTLNNLKNVRFENGVIYTDLTGTAKTQIYNFIRTSILDSRIPVVKPIGFKITSIYRTSDSSAVERNTDCLENFLELSRKVGKLIFANTAGNIGNIPEFKVLTSRNMNCYVDGNLLECISDDIVIANAIDKPVGIRFILYKSTGFSSVEKNFRTIRDIPETHAFFPIASYHSITEHVNIKPIIGDGVIRYTTSNPYMEKHLPRLWYDYVSAIEELCRTTTDKSLEEILGGVADGTLETCSIAR